MTGVRRTIIVVASSVLLAFTGGASIVTAADGSTLDDGGASIRGDALTRATKAALADTGGGRVTGTEVDDEDSYYEVEVTLDDGRRVDVQLDEAFDVVSSSRDEEGDPVAGS